MEFFKQFFAKKCAVGGLDLGTKNLKLVQLNQKKDKILIGLLFGSSQFNKLFSQKQAFELRPEGNALGYVLGPKRG